jgi:hypothetical protein
MNLRKVNAIQRIEPFYHSLKLAKRVPREIDIIKQRERRSNHLLFQQDENKSEIRDGLTRTKKPEINSQTLHFLSSF